MFDSTGSVSVPLSLIHTIWNVALTVGGGALVFFAKEAKRVIDQKADKEMLIESRKALTEKLDDLKDTVETLTTELREMHTANTQRIDELLHSLIARGRTD